MLFWKKMFTKFAHFSKVKTHFFNKKVTFAPPLFQELKMLLFKLLINKMLLLIKNKTQSTNCLLS